jgi:hypothetical protein
MNNYFSDWKQFNIEWYKDDQFFVGPVHFLFYVNDIPSITNSKAVMYVDGTSRMNRIFTNL